MARSLDREPVTLEEAKRHLGVRSPMRDDEIAGLIIAARERVEGYTGRALVRREVVQVVDRFDADGPFVCDLGPVHRVVAVEYLSGGAMVELADAFVPVGPIGNQWHIYAGGAWPVLGPRGVAQVRYVAGFGPLEPDGEGDVVPVPEMLVRAMLLLVGTWFENHEGAVVGTSVVELPFGVKDLCRDFRPSGVV